MTPKTATNEPMRKRNLLAEEQELLSALRLTVAALDSLLDQHAERGTYLPKSNRIATMAKEVIARVECSAKETSPHLIAAAPELLEMLRVIAKKISDASGHPMGWADTSEAITALVAKAEGRA